MRVNQVHPSEGHWVTSAMHLLKRNGSGAVSVALQDSLNVKLLVIEMSHLFQSVLFVLRRTYWHISKVNYST
jgi:hypothetical protein